MLFACKVKKIVYCMRAAVRSHFVFRSGSGLKIQLEVGAVACKGPKFSLCMGACFSFFAGRALV